KESSFLKRLFFVPFVSFCEKSGKGIFFPFVPFVSFCKKTQPPSVKSSCSRAGFTKIEMVGVLCVITILVSSIIPTIIRRVDIAARNRDINDLAAISNAIVYQVLRNYNIPDESQAFGVVSNWAGVPLTYVSKNVRGWTRLCFVETNSSS